MSITNLSLFVSESEIDPAVARDTEVQEFGDARYIRKYTQYFRAAPSVSQVLSQNVVTKINFNTITSNIGNQYSAANDRLIALESEQWRITTAIEFNLPASSRFILWLSKNNGTTLIQLLDITTVGFFNTTVTPADISLVSGDYLELWTRVYNIPNGSIFGDTSLKTCWWEGRRVG